MKQAIVLQKLVQTFSPSLRLKVSLIIYDLKFQARIQIVFCEKQSQQKAGLY